MNDNDVRPTLETRTAGSSTEWTRADPADRLQWQWPDNPDWLASEALWLLGEGREVRLVSIRPDGEKFGDYTSPGCLSLNPPSDDPVVPADAHWDRQPVPEAGQRIAVAGWPGRAHPASEVTKLRERVRELEAALAAQAV